uniref:Adenylate kinase active site lid domain-containing protein n=1 Tax=Junco hyemalis TaxID=40217 RepID=A0A8C5NP28_JUNHY
MSGSSRQLNIILVGPPGAGKGTHSVHIEQKYNIPHISTGDIFRDAISKGTPMGVKAKEFIDKGELVPDEITVGIVRERLLKKDTESGFLLDGFPRTLDQCGASFNIKTLLPKVDGICDYCGANLIQRKDDTAEAFKTRMTEYEAKTAPIIDFYSKKGLVRVIDTTSGIVEEGNKEIDDAVAKLED